MKQDSPLAALFCIGIIILCATAAICIVEIPRYRQEQGQQQYQEWHERTSDLILRQAQKGYLLPDEQAELDELNKRMAEYRIDHPGSPEDLLEKKLEKETGEGH